MAGERALEMSGRASEFDDAYQSGTQGAWMCVRFDEHDTNLERRGEAPFENSGQADATRTRHTALYLDAPLQIFNLTVCDQRLVVVTGYIKLCGL